MALNSSAHYPPTWRHPIARFFGNPYYRSGAIIAKLATNLATAAWSLLVLSREGVTVNSAYAQLLSLIPEDVVAWGMLVLSVTQTAWLWFYWKPLRWGSAGYGLQCGWWFAVLFLICMSSPLRAAPIAAIGTVVILAGLAFVTLPRRGRCDADAG
jgi:hypothetical protein